MNAKADAKTIRVMVRIRPPNEREKQEGSRTDIFSVDKSEKLITCDGVNENFTFHHIFRSDSKQEDVYTIYAKDAVEKALEGYHGILFAYGQTGSGKTHTISCTTPGKEGVLQRCLQDIWAAKAKDKHNQYSINVSYVELYNEAFTDLLANPNENAALTMHATDDVYLVRSDGQEIGRSAPSIQDAMRYFDVGSSRKSVAETAMNDRSSRSHTIFTVYITKQPVNGGECMHGRLILCDLAGSERLKKSQTVGKQSEEAKFINTSLLQLGVVVRQMAERKQMPSFRNSKLTQLLRYSLSGKGCTSIMVTVSPSEFNKSESLSSMRFGQCAITIKQEPEKHVDIDYKTLCEKLKAQVAELEQRLQTRDAGAIDLMREEYERRIAEIHEDYATRGASIPCNPSSFAPGTTGASAATGVDMSTTPKVIMVDGVEHRPYDAYMALNVVRKRIQEKESMLQESRQNLITAIHERDAERQKVWDIALVLRRERYEFAAKEAKLQDQIDRLLVRIQSETTDLSSTQVTAEDELLADLMAQSLEQSAPMTARGAASSNGDTSSFQAAWAEEQLKRSQKCIALLREQRIALRSQLDKAKRSIRLLTQNPELVRTQM